jgi:hypothetical protein
MNKYKQWYSDIIEKAKNRFIDVYTENHHIIPRSLGGTNDQTNLVKLTAREHFICHWLLVKMTTGQDHYKMLNALRMMKAEKQGQQRYRTKITARVYENIKQEYADLQSKNIKGVCNGMYGKNHTDEAKQKISKANKGRVQPPDEKERQKLAWKKRQEVGLKRAELSEAHRKLRSLKYAGEGNPRYGVEVSEETRDKQRKKAQGRKQSKETIQKKADAIRGLKRQKKLCLHCNREVAINGYFQWHGDKCKLKLNI